MDIYCLHCGAKMPRAAKFCVSCGKELYRPEMEPLPSKESEEMMPHISSSVESSTAPQMLAPEVSLGGCGAKEQGRITPVKKVTIAATSLYCVVVISAMFLHKQANAEAKIVTDVEEVQTQFIDLVSSRAQRSPLMLTLLKWPEGASDGSAEGFMSRTDELAPLLNNELAACKKVHERAIQLLARVPADNPNHVRAALLAKATQDDMDLYESFLREVPLAAEAGSRPPAMRADFLNSKLWALRDQQNENLKRRQTTIEQLK
jgi:ribosomal protein L40E